MFLHGIVQLIFICVPISTKLCFNIISGAEKEYAFCCQSIKNGVPYGVGVGFACTVCILIKSLT